MTTTRRLTLLLFVFLAWAPAAYAWSWPVQGPVLQPFAYDETHPYAAGKHRGVDIGADAAGETVVAPASGTVSFAGTVPTNGKSVTIETDDGYSVTLTHLGSIVVLKGATVAEQDAIGTVGPSGTPEVDGPYVHLGIRLTADPNGYVDPLDLLPPVSESSATSSQPTTTAASPVAPASKPAPSVQSSPRVKTTRESTVKPEQRHVATHEHGRAREPRADARPRPATVRSAVRDVRAPAEITARRPRSRQPVVEPASMPAGVRHELRPPSSVARVAPVRRSAPPVLVPALCNGVPALLALAAALMTLRGRRRRRSEVDPAASGQVIHLPRPDRDQPRVRRAA